MNPRPLIVASAMRIVAIFGQTGQIINRVQGQYAD